MSAAPPQVLARIKVVRPPGRVAYAGLARGQLHPRAVSLYNALHRFWGPLALAVAALAAGLPLGYVAGASAWGVHVAFDRAIGLRPAPPTASSALRAG
jgi:F0F1-type ATP synthase membrane subunit c/vacuolar-type H+-ATPase subunit K